jgi:epoxyqueuosine reductase
MDEETITASDVRDDVRRKIKNLAATHPANLDEAGYRYFGAPLVGFASASDPLFTEYKKIIGPFHWTPFEALGHAGPPEGILAGTVVCWVLPVTKIPRASNAKQKNTPSLEWARARNFGENFNNEVRKEVADFIVARGGYAIAPMLADGWAEVEDPVTGIASTWSERHAAYAAGLGTFGLNAGFITPVGVAHRIGSVVTDIVMEPSERPYRNHTENCLSGRGIECGACIARCPCGAISPEGHDKNRCSSFYNCSFEWLRKEYGVLVTGCGLCQTGVPCEGSIP